MSNFLLLFMYICLHPRNVCVYMYSASTLCVGSSTMGVVVHDSPVPCIYYGGIETVFDM